MSVTPVSGNNNFTSVANTTLAPSSLQDSLTALSIENQYPIVSITDVNAGGASGNLTAAQLQEAYKSPYGLRLVAGAAAAVNLIGTATTAAAALLIQQALGLTAVGQGRMLKFFVTDTPTGDLTLGPNAGNVTVSNLGAATADLLQFTGLAGAGTDGTILVYVQATNVTAGAQAVLSTIVKTGQIGA